MKMKATHMSKKLQPFQDKIKISIKQASMEALALRKILSITVPRSYYCPKDS
jgi:hypothetical protein